MTPRACDAQTGSGYTQPVALPPPPAVALSRVVVACAARTCLAGLALHQRQVHAVLCLAENAINERAVRNDDIITL